MSAIQSVRITVSGSTRIAGSAGNRLPAAVITSDTATAAAKVAPVPSKIDRLAILSMAIVGRPWYAAYRRTGRPAERYRFSLSSARDRPPAAVIEPAPRYCRRPSR